jgi:hypothetical protein
MKHDEEDRTNYQCNTPYDPIRPGILGVDSWDIVDLDEFGRQASDTNPSCGHSIDGTA